MNWTQMRRRLLQGKNITGDGQCCTIPVGNCIGYERRKFDMHLSWELALKAISNYFPRPHNDLFLTSKTSHLLTIWGRIIVVVKVYSYSCTGPFWQCTFTAKYKCTAFRIYMRNVLHLYAQSASVFVYLLLGVCSLQRRRVCLKFGRALPAPAL